MCNGQKWHILLARITNNSTFCVYIPYLSHYRKTRPFKFKPEPKKNIQETPVANCTGICKLPTHNGLVSVLAKIIIRIPVLRARRPVKTPCQVLVFALSDISLHYFHTFRCANNSAEINNCKDSRRQPTQTPALACLRYFQEEDIMQLKTTA